MASRTAPAFGVSSPAAMAASVSQVGRATGDGQDPGDLPRGGRQPSPGVEQRVAQLVGQVVGQLVGVEVAASDQ